ncbi:MAG: CRISPR-associated protein Cas5, partial [Candidatus Latescibacteria bacterium]|nr:CRISPR-associated protein Cas5 [Candidatus Latescibacterota bacterium]
MLCLYLQAPFAAFRTFTTGSFRPTAGFITHSAAYGLLLNAAGIEMRQENEGGPMTLIRSDLPRFRLAVGACEIPRMHSVYQQLHNYPVGNTRRDFAPRAKGAKYNIAPARRTFLGDLRSYLCMEGNSDLEQKVIDGLQGKIVRDYGLPFAGDNNFLLDRLEPVE